LVTSRGEMRAAENGIQALTAGLFAHPCLSPPATATEWAVCVPPWHLPAGINLFLPCHGENLYNPPLRSQQRNEGENRCTN
jgi:hypothetical protein